MIAQRGHDRDVELLLDLIEDPAGYTCDVRVVRITEFQRICQSKVPVEDQSTNIVDLQKVTKLLLNYAHIISKY